MFVLTAFVSSSAPSDSLSWGDAALNFEADDNLELSNTEPVIVIFVGTLVKTYDG